MKKIINSIFGLFDLSIVKNSQLNTKNGLGYISANDTVKEAKKFGLSICDYVEQKWNQVGETEQVVSNMEKLGVFENANPTICEIGAGTGRYMEKVIAKCNPEKYESYETADDWAKWLQNKYNIISYKSDGRSLQNSEDDSIDLIHAHGVFVYIPFFDSLRYFKEIDRVTKKNSYIIFDCITDDCLDNKWLNKWIYSKYNYPRNLPEKYIYDFFSIDNYKLIGNFFTPYGQGKSKYFVFKKK